MSPSAQTSTANYFPPLESHPQPNHTGMSYSKQHYILHDEQEIYTNTDQHGNLLHSESQAEAEGVSTVCNTNIILIGNRTINKQNYNINLAFKCFKTKKRTRIWNAFKA